MLMHMENLCQTDSDICMDFEALQNYIIVVCMFVLYCIVWIGLPGVTLLPHTVSHDTVLITRRSHCSI